jgi:GAF domain-containing protein
MGQKLYDFYLRAGELGGVKARTKLSIVTKISSSEAISLPDDTSKIKIFEDAWPLITKEFGQAVKNTAETTTIKINEADTADKLRNNLSVFSDLLAQRFLYKNDLKKAIERVTESLVNAIKVERASIWFYTPAKDGIICYDLFVKSKMEHSSGITLSAKDYPNYFKAIESEKTLPAFNAHTDARTAEFSEGYLKPLGINSMLDVPIWSEGKMIGVVCHEHTGDFRKWNSDEENFAYLVGHTVGMLIEYTGGKL